MNVAIYVRISRDATGESAGVQRQEQDCRALAEAKGWTVSNLYSDNDISAYSGTRRPGYEAMLEAISAKQVDAVICWHPDRLYRRLADLEKYINVCQPVKVPTYTVQSAGELDLTTPSGRMVARTLGNMAQYESEQKGERQKRANLQRAKEGKHFGTRRCFGYEPDGLTLREEEAKALLDACHLIASGGALNAVARKWNAAGLLTPQAGNLWTGPVVSRTLKTHRIAGLKTYHGEIMRDHDGHPIPTEWPAIIPLDLWRAVQDVFAAPERRAFPSAERQLLSGVAKCGVCGARIQSGGTRNGRRRYRCSGNNAHPYREAEPIDTYAEGQAIALLAQPDAVDLFRPASTVDVSGVRDEIAALRARADELAEAFADGAVTRSQLTRGTERTLARVAALEATLPKPANPSVAALIAAEDVPAAWDALDIDTRRAVINDLLIVEILPARTKERAYIDWRLRIINPETVRITRRDAPKDHG